MLTLSGSIDSTVTHLSEELPRSNADEILVQQIRRAATQSLCRGRMSDRVHCRAKGKYFPVSGRTITNILQEIKHVG